MNATFHLDLISTGVRTLAILSFVLGLLFLVLYLIRRFVSPGRGKGGDMSIKVISSLPLSPKQRVEVIDISGEKIVLGITPGSITFLTRINESITENRFSDGKQKTFKINE